MKNLVLILISFFTIQITVAQIASDYYLPLCVGNYLKFYTPDGGGGGWEARTTFHSIVQADSINGELYYLQKGYEVMDYNQSVNVFHYFWLRKGVNGEILMGAYDLTGNGIIDSATVTPSGSVYFTNQFLTPGYSQSFMMGPGVTSTDSVVSISATAGIYTNCLQIRRTRKANGVVDMMEEFYYAWHMGIVKSERLIPANQIHVNNLVDFTVFNCNITGITDDFSNENKFSIYPNPASYIVTFNTNNPNRADLTLNIYTIAGELVKTELLKENQRQINIADLNNGVYIIETKSKESTERQKLILQR